MFSEFEIAKPHRNFSQLHLEFNEVVFASIPVRMLLEEEASLPGQSSRRDPDLNAYSK